MTNFSFDDTIPATGHDPSDDYTIMRNNNVSTDGILDIDHISFNTNNGGQHKAITFNQDASYVPAVFPVSPPKLFTDTSGVPGLRYYSGTQAQSADQYVLASNGSVMLMGGIIMKWVNVAVGAGTTAFTFTALAVNDFPNNAWCAQATNKSSTTPNLIVSALSVSGFSVISNQASNIYVLIIGN